MTISSFLDGNLLLAMPGMSDPRFERSVLYICTHDASGAMGIVINQPFNNLDFPALLVQLDIDVPGTPPETPIHCGGPLEPGRGFVLHSADYVQESTLITSETLALTATIDILKAIAGAKGPKHHLLALGYAGWGAGQLEVEIAENAWMTSDADEEIIFYTEMDLKWSRAMARLGINISMLSTDAGHA